jgi:branched-chain amino acid transport system permease protein
MVAMSDKKQGASPIFEGFKLRSDIGFYALMILLALFPIFVSDAYLLNVMIIALISAILAASWNLIVGYTGIFTFGHQAFFGIGAYVSSLLAMKAGVSPWLGLVIAGLTAALLSCAIGLPCLRLRAAPYIAIMTLAFSEIARITCMNLVDLTRGEMGLWGIPNFPSIQFWSLGSISFSGASRVPYYYLIVLIFGATMLFLYFIVKSPIGLAFKSIRDSQDAAESLGINITLYKLAAFVGSAFFAGVVGSFYAHYLLILTPTSVFSVGMMTEILAITLIGGMGTFLGPAVVAFILTIGLEYLRFLGEYRFITYGVLLVVVIMFMPNGLGRKLFRDREVSD